MKSIDVLAWAIYFSIIVISDGINVARFIVFVVPLPLFCFFFVVKHFIYCELPSLHILFCSVFLS